MRRIAKGLTAGAAIILGVGVAHAQSTPPTPGAPPGPGLSTENPALHNEGDNWERTTEAAQAEEIQREREERARKSHAVPAAKADIVVGRDVADMDGVPVGKIDSLDVDGAVVVTPTAKVRVPYDAFGKTSSGLILSITKQEFDKLAAAATTPAPTGNSN